MGPGSPSPLVPHRPSLAPQIKKLKEEEEAAELAQATFAPEISKMARELKRPPGIRSSSSGQLASHGSGGGRGNPHFTARTAVSPFFVSTHHSLSLSLFLVLACLASFNLGFY